MANLDEDEVRRQLAGMQASGPDSYLAARQIQKWRNDGIIPEGDRDLQVRLYMAVKACDVQAM